MAKLAVASPFDINAAPAKAFFVDMITRDIELQDAILDLLDNCVDGIRRSGKTKGSQPYKGHYAKIEFNEDSFIIEDNCGGIPLDVAKTYAFMMGRPAKVKDGKPGTIGVYGIGMKRAIFKMGRSCVVHSYTKELAFEVEIPEPWLEDDGAWTLQYRNAKPSLKTFGTKITVRNLNPVVRSEFAAGSEFRKTFAGIVRDAYSFLLAKGFSVTINKVDVTPKVPTLLWDDSNKTKVLRPYVYKAELENVKVFLTIGFRERPVTSPNEDTDAAARYRSEDAGWSIVCNDRVVLAHDKTEQTGWGWGVAPSYHTQYIAITGFVIFEGNAADLPMTTTKRGVNANSALYTTIRARMQKALLRFTKFTNDWKGHDISPVFENAASKPLTDIQREVDADETELRVIPGTDNERQSKSTLPERPRDKTHSRISFIKPTKEVSKVSLYLFEEADRKPSEVGAECFNFVLNKAK